MSLSESLQIELYSTLNPISVIHFCFNLTRCFFITRTFPKILPLCSSVASLPALESMLANELLIQKLGRFASECIEISLFLITVN